jgi:hypothetical protein
LWLPVMTTQPSVKGSIAKYLLWVAACPTEFSSFSQTPIGPWTPTAGSRLCGRANIREAWPAILKFETACAYQPSATELVRPLPANSKDAVISAEDFRRLKGNLGGEVSICRDAGLALPGRRIRAWSHDLAGARGCFVTE